MATKKKAAAKPAKKAIPPKKSAPAKKPVAKSASNGKAANHSKSHNGKASKPAAPPKKSVKAASKASPVKKTPPAKAVKPNGTKPNGIKADVQKASMPSKDIKQVEVKKAISPMKEEKKPEIKKAEVKSPEPVAQQPQPKKPAAPPAKPSKLVIPEMKTKTARKYEPDFTKSVLDQPEQIFTGPTMRYSDSELYEFRELIQKKLDQAKKELSYLQGLITRKDEMGGDDAENRYMTMEDGSMSMEREQLAQMASRQINYIDHLEKAIIRIENKTYGICRVTGKLIDKARLRAVPHATLSIEAKQTMNR